MQKKNRMSFRDPPWYTIGVKQQVLLLLTQRRHVGLQHSAPVPTKTDLKPSNCRTVKLIYQKPFILYTSLHSYSSDYSDFRFQPLEPTRLAMTCVSANSDSSDLMVASGSRLCSNEFSPLIKTWTYTVIHDELDNDEYLVIRISLLPTSSVLSCL